MSAVIVQSIRELTGRVLEHSSNLLGNYHPHDLHQFRVCTRRIRALLKRLKSRPAGFFLKSWADLFSVTSRARDLDVFLDSASQLLPAEQFRLFEPILVPHLQASHEAVIRMLQSGTWHRHMAGWRGFLINIESRPPEVARGHLSRVRKKARKACLKAMATGEDRDWHRFRIAIKNLRYVAEARKNDPEADQARLDALIEDCEVLQTLLGDWHDTVIQLQLLHGDDLSVAFGATSALTETGSILDKGIRSRKTDLLGQIGDSLQKIDLFSA